MKTPIVWRPSGMIAPKPALATAAPTNPPTSACDDEEGSPRYAVTTFQVMAPASPAKMTPIEITSGCTTPVAIVDATAVPKTAKAMKLKNAAQTTAWNGLSTLVETMVAIEFAASWKPLTKSKASAT